MGYTNEEIIEILKRPRVEGVKSSALNSQKHHKLHVTGHGYYTWWLGDQAKGFESIKTHEKKKEICKPTTPRIFEGIQKQFSKIFRAKGDVFEYAFTDNSKDKINELKSILSNVGEGMSIDNLMQNIWNKAMFEDFNGFFGVELEKEENLEDSKTPEPKVCFYPLEQIYDVCVEGNDIEYIVIKTVVKNYEKEYEAFRFIDEERDVVFVLDGSEYRVNIITDSATGEGREDSFPNPFQKVPFVQISQYRANVYDSFLKNSPVSKVIANADTYLSVSDDHQVCVKRHQNPIFFSYPVTCPTCNGTKTQRVPDTTNPNDYVEDDCGYCQGNGSVSYLKGDVLQGISLAVVEKYEVDGFPAAQAPAGYIDNDHESIREQRVELADQERFIEKGSLGVEGILTRDNSRETTATKAELDLQPLMDTLNFYSYNAEYVRKKLTDFIGYVMFPTTYMGAYIHYGRKYFLKGEDKIIEEYNNAKKAGTNDAFQKELLEELYYVKFENNPTALKRSLMLLDIEPIPTRNNIDEIIKIAPYTSAETLLIKVNFNDLIERFEREIMPITMYKPEMDYAKRISEIQKQISVYAKEINPPRVEPNGNGSGV